MGVQGLPHSATGQTALFTGVNAAQLLGRHLGAYPNAPLTEVINEHNILKRATERGYRATFANAYTPQYFQLVKERKRRHSATTLSILAAGLPFRTLENLKRGEAVYWDITHFYLAGHLHMPVPIIEPETAGQRLARLSRDYDLVLYESFLPDAVGHRGDPEMALETLDMLDRFFAGLLEEVRPTATVVMSSDHGNLEEIGLRLHSTNPVPLLVVGPGAESFRQAQAITDVAGGIMRVLEQGPLPRPISAPPQSPPTLRPCSGQALGGKQEGESSSPFSQGWEKGVRGMRANDAKNPRRPLVGFLLAPV